MSPSNKKKSGKTKPVTPTTSHASTVPANNAITDATSSPATSTSVAFREFIELASLDNIKQFITAASTTPEGENIRLLWGRAFKEGLMAGHLLFGKTEEKINKAHSAGFQEGFDEGGRQVYGDMVLEGHGPHCFEITTNVYDDYGNKYSDQPSTASVDSSTQTDPQPVTFVTTTNSFTHTENDVDDGPHPNTNRHVPTPADTSLSPIPLHYHINMPESHEDSVYLAKLAEQAERYEKMAENMKRVASSDQELTVEERHAEFAFSNKHKDCTNKPLDAYKTAIDVAVTELTPTATATSTPPPTISNHLPSSYTTPKPLTTSQNYPLHPSNTPKPPDMSQSHPKSPKRPVSELKQPISTPNSPNRRVFGLQPPVSSPRSPNRRVFDPQGRVFDIQTPVSSPKWSQQRVLDPLQRVSSPKSPQQRVFEPLQRVSDLQPPVSRPKSPLQCISDSYTPVSNRKSPSPPSNTSPDIPTPPTTPFNWADNAASLPTHFTQLPPRDLSVLCSSSLTPFSSIQRRNKQFRPHFSQPFCYHISFPIPHKAFSRHYFPPSHVSSTLFKPYPTKSHHTPLQSLSALNWEDDPRLFELSRALNVLGWVRH
jgi:hypothetical protein